MHLQFQLVCLVRHAIEAGFHSVERPLTPLAERLFVEILLVELVDKLKYFDFEEYWRVLCTLDEERDTVDTGILYHVHLHFVTQLILSAALLEHLLIEPGL